MKLLSQTTVYVVLTTVLGFMLSGCTGPLGTATRPQPSWSEGNSGGSRSAGRGAENQVPEAWNPVKKARFEKILAMAESLKPGSPEIPVLRDRFQQAMAEWRHLTVSANSSVVIIETSMGTIKAELWAEKAPVTVKNFLRYTDEKHYDGLIFHRVIKGFMIQGGGYDGTMVEANTHEPIRNEATADKRNLRGTLSMARTNIVDSATAQFFINLNDNAFIDHRNETAVGFGYCVFGRVIEGLDVVDRIGAVATGRTGSHSDVPLTAVVIKSIRRSRD